MLRVLMVGEQGSQVDTLYFALRHREVSVQLAHDPDTLHTVLTTEQVDLVIFDHVAPTDLFALNPRGHGFSGPVVLLVDDPDPVTAREVLHTDLALTRPFLLSSLLHLIDEIASSTPS
jgi:hypothetical protein